jgi:hypothetical protein
VTRKTAPSAIRIALALVATLVVAWSLAPAAQARPLCECMGSYETPVTWGLGPTCSEAYWDLWNRAFALAQETCGIGDPCDGSLVITSPCTGAGCAAMVVEGKILHGCCYEGLDP